MARPNGSTNKNKDYLMNRLQDMYGKDFDPIIKCAENAIRMQAIADGSMKMAENESIEIEDRIAAKIQEFDQRKDCVMAWDKIAQYIQPKLKAIEVKAEVSVAAHEAWLENLK